MKSISTASVLESVSGIEASQQTIHTYFTQLAKKCSPEDNLRLFRQVFIEFTKHDSSIDISTALITILLSNEEQKFQHTLKRVCYILINDWWIQRKHTFIQKLIQEFDDPSIQRHSLSKVMQRLRSWIHNFKISQDFKDLVLYTNSTDHSGNWHVYYKPYLLSHHYLNSSNPVEQRQISRLIAYDLKMNFRHRLALFKSRYQFNRLEKVPIQNPSMLNESVLFIAINKILVYRRLICEKTLRKEFYKKLENKSFLNFKEALTQYFIFFLKQSRIASQFRLEAPQKLMGVYADQDHEPIHEALVIKSCKRIVEMLTSEDHQTLAPLMSLFLAENCPLELALLLQIIALLCPEAKDHIDFCIANLVRYSERLQAKDVQAMINFLEIFRVVFAIYADYDHHTLVKATPNVA